MTSEFRTFSIQHLAILFFLAGLAMVVIGKGQRSGKAQQLNLAISIAGFTFSIEMIETIVLIVQGRYDYHVDLPLFLCDLSAMMLPFVLYRQNRKWIGILYFWTMAGTLQALLTPDLKEGFPSFEFIRYFFMHGCIVIAILYTVLVFKIQISWRDLLNAILYAQVYLVGIHLINRILRTNYGYTIHKPSSPTILDYFGPWPWYILWGEGLMVVLFLMLLLPFLLFNSSGSTRKEKTFEQH